MERILLKVDYLVGHIIIFSEVLTCAWKKKKTENKRHQISSLVIKVWLLDTTAETFPSLQAFLFTANASAVSNQMWSLFVSPISYYIPKHLPFNSHLYAFILYLYL